MAETLNYEVENKKREEATKEALSTLLEKYKTEEVSKEERITEYLYAGYGGFQVEDETKEFKCTISFDVKPYSEENSIWDKTRQVCFAEFDRIDGELILRKVYLVPEKYDEFKEAYNEYEKNEKSTFETSGVPSSGKLVASSNEIEELGNWIFRCCGFILFVVSVVYIILKIKNRKK